MRHVNSNGVFNLLIKFVKVQLVSDGDVLAYSGIFEIHDTGIGSLVTDAVNEARDEENSSDNEDSSDDDDDIVEEYLYADCADDSDEEVVTDNLEGVSSYVNFPTPPEIQPGNNYELKVWVNGTRSLCTDSFMVEKGYGLKQKHRSANSGTLNVLVAVRCRNLNCL